MEPTPNFSEQLDQYLLGRMSEQEREAFAARAEQDPLLAQEMRLQQDVVAGLRRARTAQLKARLNNIPTPPAAGLSIAQWVGLGTAASVLVAGGLVLYLAQTPNHEQARQDSARQVTEVYTPAEAPATTQAEASTPAPQPIAQAPDGADATADKALTEARPEPTIVSPAKPTEVSPAQRVSKPASQSTAGEGLSLYKGRSVKEPIQAAPESLGLGAAPDEEAEDAALIHRPDIGALPTGKVVENNDVKSKPEVVIKESDVLSYQYFDNRLFLYGGFGDAIYELIELVNPKEGRRLYVYYRDRFYRVDNNVRDVTPMSEVTDPKLAAELTLLRKKRID